MNGEHGQPAGRLLAGSLRGLGGKTLRLCPSSAGAAQFVIEADQREYARIAFAPEITMEALEAAWTVVPAGRRGWNLVATSARDAPAAWFQRAALGSGGALLVPDGTEYRLQRHPLRRSRWALTREGRSLTRFSVHTGKQPWEITMDLNVSDDVSTDDALPVILLLSCVAVVMSRATETATGGSSLPEVWPSA